MYEVHTNLFDNGGVIKAIENNYAMSEENQKFLKDMIKTHLSYGFITRKEAEHLTKKYLCIGGGV